MPARNELTESQWISQVNHSWFMLVLISLHVNCASRVMSTYKSADFTCTQSVPPTVLSIKNEQHWIVGLSPSWLENLNLEKLQQFVLTHLNCLVNRCVHTSTGWDAMKQEQLQNDAVKYSTKSSKHFSCKSSLISDDLPAHSLAKSI